MTDTRTPDTSASELPAGFDLLRHRKIRPSMSTMAAALLHRVATLKVRAGLVVVCLLALRLGAVGMTNEGYVTLQGDMPRYLMNGAYLVDLVKDRPFGSVTQLLDYSRLYYARYPALSLGHHPMLLPAAEVPAYALFGISVGAARLIPLLSFIAAAAFLYLLVFDIYGSALVAFLAAAFFATNPWLLVLAQSVLSEMPTLALVVASAFYVRRFSETQQRGALIGFAVCAALSLYAKQLAIFPLLGFLVYAAAKLGIRRLLARDVLVAGIASAVAVLPLVPLTLVLSRANVTAIVQSAHSGSHAGPAGFAVAASVLSAVSKQFTLAFVALAAVAVLWALRRKDRRVLLPLLWAASAFSVLLLTGRMEPPRYAVYGLPALCVLAASLAVDWRDGIARRAVVAIPLAVLVFQWSVGNHQPLPGATGYEEAAQFVVNADPGPTVLFSGDVDTGFFTFFVRKHDAARKLVVLRGDKILTTSYMSHSSIEDRIQRPDQIYDILHRFGTRYVVIEDRPSGSRVLEWLRQELRSARFIERKRIPIQTRDRRLRGTSLVVYEFTDRTPPDENAVLSVNIPLIKESVSVRLADLIDRKYLKY